MTANQGAEYEPYMFDIQADTSDIRYDPDIGDDSDMSMTGQDNTNPPNTPEANIGEVHVPVVTIELICQKCRQTWRVRNMRLWQIKTILWWIKRYPVKPTKTEKTELLRGSELTRTQLKGILKRAWEAASVSHQAVKRVSVVGTASNPTTSWAGTGLHEHEINVTHENLPDTIDLGYRFGSFDGNKVQWHLETCLPGVGSQFPYQHSSLYTGPSSQGTSRPSHDSRLSPSDNVSFLPDLYTQGAWPSPTVNDEDDTTVNNFYLVCDFCEEWEIL